MATLVSSAMLLPVTWIDALEFAMNDIAHFLRVCTRNTAAAVRERSIAFGVGDSERHAPMLIETIRQRVGVASERRPAPKGPRHALAG